MGKLFFLVLIGAAGYYLYATGILLALIDGNTPQIGKECEINSPYGDSVLAAYNKQTAAIPIDATIGSGYMRLPAVAALKTSLKNGQIVKVKNGTRTKILENDKVTLYAVPHQLVKVKILEGDYEGSKAWVERDRVIDTPLQAIWQLALRPNKLNKDEQD